MVVIGKEVVEREGAGTFEEDGDHRDGQAEVADADPSVADGIGDVEEVQEQKRGRKARPEPEEEHETEDDLEPAVYEDEADLTDRKGRRPCRKEPEP